ncbi:MAG: flagellar assembly protein FliH [Selenomonadaceae bacterium]|nr:flagellar assembly protein FliH [Selenomonadaceae bacterium]
MSRVIKAAMWQDEPKVIGVKNAKKVDAAEDASEAGLDKEEAYARKLAAVEEREEAAKRALQEAQVAADMLRQEAQEYRDKLMADTQKEVAALREETKREAHEEGYRVGHEEGESAVRKEMADFIKATNEQAERILQTAKDATRDYLVEADHTVAELAMHIAEKILPQHFIDVPQVVLPLVRDALKRVQDQKEIVIHVPPDSYEFVLMARDEFRAMLPGGNASLTVHSDDSLHPGDCLIETESGSVDARLATQLELIRNAIQEKMM